MARPRTRLKDIAAATGFSANTVSLALRGSSRIPQETRDRIRETAEQLDYVPNHVAQSLVGRATKTIGVVLTDLTNPILTVTAQAIESRLSERGYSMMLAASDNDFSKERKALGVLRARQVDGLFVYPAHHRDLDHFRPMRRAGYPIILLAAFPTDDIDIVAVDDRAGAAQAVAHLLALGRRRIGLIDDSRQRGNSEKFDGYESALKAAGLVVDPSLLAVPDRRGATGGYRAAAQLIDEGVAFDALFAATDTLAIGAMRLLRERGLRVPEDVAMVGFDDIEAAEFSEIPLSSVRYPAEAVSAFAVERLLELILAPEELPAPKTVLIEPMLIVRRSSGGASP